MNCKKCKTYNTNAVEVFNTITKRLNMFCFVCWKVAVNIGSYQA